MNLMGIVCMVIDTCLDGENTIILSFYFLIRTFSVKNNF